VPAPTALNLIWTSRAAELRSVLVSMLPEKCKDPPSTTASKMPDPICFVFVLKVTSAFGSSMAKTAGSKKTNRSNVPRYHPAVFTRKSTLKLCPTERSESGWPSAAPRSTSPALVGFKLVWKAVLSSRSSPLGPAATVAVTIAAW
jgi:hypothetical protein